MWKKQRGVLACTMFLGFIGMISYDSAWANNAVNTAGKVSGLSAMAEATPAPTSTPGTPTPTPTPTPSEAGNIAGQVTDAATNAGINGATVTVEGTGQTGTTQAVQGQNGVYVIPNVPVGTQTVTASAAGHLPSSKDVAVEAGQPNPQTGKNTVNFALTAGTPTPVPSPTPSCEVAEVDAEPEKQKILREESGEITVTLTCGDGSPSANRLVNVNVKSGKKRVTVEPATALTDENGQAVFTVTATTKTGDAKITFLHQNLKDTVTVRVRKK